MSSPKHKRKRRHTEPAQKRARSHTAARPLLVLDAAGPGRAAGARPVHRFLAVPELSTRRFLPFLRPWGSEEPVWHAVADVHPTPTHTLCGGPYTAEAHRTWELALTGARCPLCAWLVRSAPGAAVIDASDPRIQGGSVPRPLGDAGREGLAGE